jgi:lipid-binding SYLF domain-containing protein
LFSTKAKIGGVVLAVIFALTACSTAGGASTKSEINANVKSALLVFDSTVSGGNELRNKAAGVLIFPDVVKGGIGIGGEYGQGALMVNGQIVDYYDIFAGSIGFQLGLQVKSEVVLFMDRSSLNNFRRSEGWEVGVDGSVAVVTLGVGGEVDTNSLQQPVLGFIFSNKGLMYNLTLEGAKIHKRNR